ncbi:DUF1727 domain-containing protein [Candidatus Daviesbacteria bacterium]|nr:DUF1727 domain-containing protein [Candidatus Daviesbacteria bacterium]
MKSQLAITLGKAICFASRFFNIGGGSAAPGLFALRIDPELVEGLIKKIPTNVVITGTNGKTTTARLIAHFARAHNLKVIRNHTGSNLERGIASTLIQNSRLHLEGVNLNFDLGIWELDEAAFNLVAPKVKPDVVIFLNVFRDQLDRYGEVDSVVKRWCETLKALPKTTKVLVNGDDSNTSKLDKCFPGKVLKFGVKDYQISGESISPKRVKKKLDYEAKDIKLRNLAGSSFTLYTPYSILHTNLPLPGVYHIYDAVAALACSSILFSDTPIHRYTNTLKTFTLKTFSPAFGRVEKFTFKPQGLNTFKPQDNYIFLIKNPAGTTQVFETIAPQLKSSDRLLLALNDNLADGTDVSWIWDAQFEKLPTTNYQLLTTCSGTRAYDLANRLKYAEFDPKTINTEPNLEKAFKQARKDLKGRLFILPTYTAMLELQKILVKMGIKKHYWASD